MTKFIICQPGNSVAFSCWSPSLVEVGVAFPAANIFGFEDMSIRLIRFETTSRES